MFRKNEDGGARRPGWNLKKKNKSEDVEAREERAEEIDMSVEDKPSRKLKAGLPKRSLIIGIGGAVAIAVVVVCLLAFGKPTKGSLETALLDMGKDWYENFYYDGFDESSRTEILSRFKEIGIKVDLDNLSRYNSDENAKKLEPFKVDQKDGYNSKETKIVIKPKDPYGKTDYDISTIMVMTDQDPAEAQAEQNK